MQFGVDNIDWLLVTIVTGSDPPSRNYKGLCFPPEALSLPGLGSDSDSSQVLTTTTPRDAHIFGPVL